MQVPVISVLVTLLVFGYQSVLAEQEDIKCENTIPQNNVALAIWSKWNDVVDAACIEGVSAPSFKALASATDLLD